MEPNPEHTRQAFDTQYLSEHGTLQGSSDAFHWWIDPTRKCAVAEAGRGGKRCKAQCEFCKRKGVTGVSS